MSTAKPRSAMLPTDDLPKPPSVSHARNFGPGWALKLLLVGLVDAFGVYVILSAWNEGSMGIMWTMVALLLVVNYVYFAKKTLPLKYLLPGLVFLLVYQIFVVAYTGYVAFTNYGTGHNSTKSQALDSLFQQNERRVEGSSAYPVAIVDRSGELGMAIIDGDTVRVGTAEEPLTVAEGAVVADGKITSVPDFEVLPYAQIIERNQEITVLRVPFSDEAEQGSIRTQDGRNAYVYRSVLVYDEAADTLTNVDTGVVYTPNERGNFVSNTGEALTPGWRVAVGFENFTTAFGDTRYSGPFLKVLLWTFAFAFLSVATTFLLGLFLSLTFNHPRLRGRKIYRTLLILPYAIPGFLGALLWRGLLNERFGFFNNVLFGGADIPWLTDPFLAKVAVLTVNLWLGFPYMFLITTGALQSIPADVLEAAKIDGAGPLKTFSSIQMPLLLVSTAPLLISSFAFNFNNFTLIFMLTEGGPRFADASVPVGHTDILISMVYQISGLDGRASTNYGLASALSIMIFIIIGTISALAFRKTRQLEEVN